MANVDPKKLPAQGTAIVLSDSKQLQGTLIKNKAIVYANTVYHKFVVYNVDNNHDRDFILGTILKYCQPDDLIPVGYHEIRAAKTVAFFAKGCGPSVEKLCKDNMIVPNPRDSKFPFKLRITLNYTSTAILVPIVREINKNLNAVLNNCFNSSTRHLDLSSFHENKDLLEFTPLFVPRILSHILNMSKSLFVTIKSVDLSNNCLTNLEPLELLWGSTVHTVNLNKNELKSITALDTLKHVKLKELHLDGNPLCGNYDDVTYIQRMKQLIPGLEKLDGVALSLDPVPTYKRNYLCSLEGFDLVEQFVHKFFTMYDCNNRQLLEGFYNKSAFFSMTAVYLPGQVTSVTAQMKDYKMHSRNVMSLVDYSRSKEYLFRGVSAIMNLFTKLPRTEHDFCSFNTDLLSYTSTRAILVVHGVFREPAKSLLESERLLGFSRSFVFEHSNGQFSIVNEQLHVYNALNFQKAASFKHAKPSLEAGLPLPETPKQKRQLVEAVKLITTMNAEWSEKLLEECDYDLKRTLGLFVDLYKVDKIPQVAFTESNTAESKTGVDQQTGQPSEKPISDQKRNKAQQFDEISFGSDDFEERQMELSEISSEGKISQASGMSPHNRMPEVIDISSGEDLFGKSEGYLELPKVSRKSSINPGGVSEKFAHGSAARKVPQGNRLTMENPSSAFPSFDVSKTDLKNSPNIQASANTTIMTELESVVKPVHVKKKRTRQRGKKRNVPPAVVQPTKQEEFMPPVVNVQQQALSYVKPKNVCVRCGASYELQQGCPCFKYDFLDNCKYWLSRLQKHS